MLNNEYKIFLFCFQVLNVIELLASKSEGNLRSNLEEVHLATTEMPSVVVSEKEKEKSPVSQGLGLCSSQPAATEVVLFIVSSIFAFSMCISCPIIVFWFKNTASKVAAKHYDRMRGRFQVYRKGDSAGRKNPAVNVDNVQGQEPPIIRRAIQKPLNRIEENEDDGGQRQPLYANVSIYRGGRTSRGPSIRGSFSNINSISNANLADDVYEEVDLECISSLNYQEPNARRQSVQKAYTLRRAGSVQQSQSTIDRGEKKPGFPKSCEVICTHQDEAACGCLKRPPDTSEI